IHDGPNTGVASFTPLYTSASQTTIYGCLIYNNGTHFNLDHGLYLQNDVATGTVTVTDNIVFNNEAFGLHIYSRPAEGRLNGFDINRWSSATVRGNLVYDYGGPMVLTDSSVSGQTWSENRFYGASTRSTWQQAPDAPAAFRTWEAQTGLTGAGRYEGSGAPPTLVIVRPNQYEAGRANIIVYNWAQQSTVSADLSGVLNVGDRYVVQNVQDFFGPPVASGSYEGGNIALPMAGRTPPAPVGRGFTPPPVTGPTFNVFVVLKSA